MRSLPPGLTKESTQPSGTHPKSSTLKSMWTSWFAARRAMTPDHFRIRSDAGDHQLPIATSAIVFACDFYPGMAAVWPVSWRSALRLATAEQKASSAAVTSSMMGTMSE